MNDDDDVRYDTEARPVYASEHLDPAAAVAKPDSPKGRRMPVVYQLDGHIGRPFPHGTPEHTQWLKFLRAHGIDTKRFIVGTTVYVRRHEDGTLWLHTWQADDPLTPCPHCPGPCVIQSRVETPLVCPPPRLRHPGQYVTEELEREWWGPSAENEKPRPVSRDAPWPGYVELPKGGAT